jgi:CheY-like chemotaxis protein
MASVLLVMDDRFYRKHLRLELEDAGHAVCEALSIDRALERVSREQPDLILLDMWVDRGAGLRLLEQLRARNQDRPVLMLGHDSRQDVLRRAQALGAQGPLALTELDGVQEWIQTALAAGA